MTCTDLAERRRAHLPAGNAVAPVANPWCKTQTAEEDAMAIRKATEATEETWVYAVITNDREPPQFLAEQWEWHHLEIGHRFTLAAQCDECGGTKYTLVPDLQSKYSLRDVVCNQCEAVYVPFIANQAIVEWPS